ncbi:MAG TPA: molecular chaperone TorD family protein [Pyrinomonadaceae bacterium]|nr:molecular chaperone TorD family protein [Pyrinomonadaceae bacterium]
MELFRALAVLAEPPADETARVAEALGLGALPGAEEYTELFVFELYPYASVYVGREGMLGGEARDRVCGFWRALGQVPPAEADHLAVMLALYARLCDLEEGEGDEAGRAGWRGARRAFLWEHLLSWLPVYLVKLAEIATPFYQGWGEVLMKALLAEIEAVGGQDVLPLHLREAGGLSDPRENDTGGEFWPSLLAPARSGMILTRADLKRAGRATGCGVRLGERKFVLKSLAAQDARGTLGWLVEEAAAWEKRHRAFEKTLGAVADAWAAKAAASATLLAELKLEASKVI